MTALCHEHACVALLPAWALGPEIATECLLSPRTLHGCRDRRERGHRAILCRIAQAAYQRAVAAHRMTKDPLSIRARRKMRSDQLGQLTRYVAVHPVMRGPRSLRGID